MSEAQLQVNCHYSLVFLNFSFSLNTIFSHQYPYTLHVQAGFQYFIVCTGNAVSCFISFVPFLHKSTCNSPWHQCLSVMLESQALVNPLNPFLLVPFLKLMSCIIHCRLLLPGFPRLSLEYDNLSFVLSDLKSNLSLPHIFSLQSCFTQDSCKTNS